MYILMIARGFPTKEYPQWGCFEKDQAEALAKYGHKVVVMSVDARFGRHRGRLGLHEFENHGVTYYNYVVLPGIFFSKVVGYEFYRKKIRFHYTEKVYTRIVAEQGKPDIVYSQFFGNTIQGVLLKEKYHLPLVGIEHLARFNQDKLSHESETGAAFAFSGVDKLIAVSSSLAKSLKRWFGIDSVVVHNMYGNEFHYVQVEQRHRFPIVFVSAASLVYRKGFDFLIQSLAKANMAKESWCLNIIGWGEQEENLKKMVLEYGLDDNVHFLGKMGKTEIAKELRNSNVYVLPSRNENFSVAILEGLATGLPVIATDCGGIRECLDDRNGIIVPVDDVDAMASAIKQMMENYSQYDRRYIAEDCQRRFSPQAIAGKLTEVFDDVLKNERKDEHK